MNWLPTYRRPMWPNRVTRRRAMLALGILALGLQLFAQVMPAQVMQGAMRGAIQASAASVDEAQGLAATCLGFMTAPKGMPGKGDGKPSGQHPICPICFTLAQAQGFAAPALDFAVPASWPVPALTPSGLIGPAKEQLPPAFHSQAPPVLAVL